MQANSDSNDEDDNAASKDTEKGKVEEIVGKTE